MGSYGIGLERLLAAAIEQHYDADGIIWPMSLAPYSATVLTLGVEPEVAALADEAIVQLTALGLDVLYDDRDERPGVKFKDADLIGIPIRIAVGRRGLADRTVEWKLRTSAASEAIAVKEVGRRAASVVE